MSQRSEPTTEAGTIDDLLEWGASLLRDGDIELAVDHCARSLHLHKDDGRLFELGARVWLAGAERAYGAAAVALAGPMDALANLLMTQPGSDDEAPALHQGVRSYRPPDGQRGMRRIAEALTPLLQRQLATTSPSKSAVLILLIVRESIGPWIGQNQIAALHEQWLPHFVFGDLKLLYNAAFKAVGSQRNIDELLAIATHDPDLVHGCGRYSAIHAVLFDWVCGGQRQAPVANFDDLLEMVASGARTGCTANQLAAARSQLVRHWPGSSAVVSEIGLPEVADLLDLAGRVAATKQRLRSVDSPGMSETAVSPIESRAWQAFHFARHVAERRMPFLRLGRRKPRIALCVSGQLRGYQQALGTWRQRLLPTADFSIFIHSWRRIGRSGADPFRVVLPFQGRSFVENYRRICALIGFAAMKQRYPALFFALSETDIVDEKMIAEEYLAAGVRLDDENSEQFFGWTNQQKMHMKIESCFDLAAASGREFDLIMRLRPDMPVAWAAFNWSDVVEIGRRQPVVLAEHRLAAQFGCPVMGDQVAVGSPRVMEVYSRAWSFYPTMADCGLLACGPNFSGHQTLAQVCWVHGIFVRKLPMRFKPFQEASPLPSSVILDMLHRDTEGRHDAIDQALLAAARADIKSLK